MGAVQDRCGITSSNVLSDRPIVVWQPTLSGLARTNAATLVPFGGRWVLASFLSESGPPLSQCLWPCSSWVAGAPTSQPTGHSRYKGRNSTVVTFSQQRQQGTARTYQGGADFLHSRRTFVREKFMRVRPQPDLTPPLGQSTQAYLVRSAKRTRQPTHEGWLLHAAVRATDWPCTAATPVRSRAMATAQLLVMLPQGLDLRLGRIQEPYHG
jgi:hypothetical protein